MNFNNLYKIRNTDSSLEKQDIAMNLTVKEHQILELCFNGNVYGISKKGIEKAIGYDKSKHGTFKDLGYFLEEHDLDRGLVDFVEESDNDIRYMLNIIKHNSGNIQISLLSKFLRNMNKGLRPWFVRILLKNPNIGFNITSYNKVRQRSGMPIIKRHYVKLAKSINKSELDKLNYPVLCEIKYDGLRCMVKYDKGYVQLISRQGKDLTDQFPSVVDSIIEEINEINKLFEKDVINEITFDGEIIAKDFNTLQTMITRKGKSINDVKFIKYDLIKLNKDDLSLHTQIQRRTKLKSYKNCSKGQLCDTPIDIIDFYNEAINNNEEGIMIKELDALWTNDRNGWWKLKDVQELDLEIIDYEYGNGKNKDLISRVLVSSRDGKVKAWVGSGFNDKDRLYMTENKDKLKSKIVEIHYFETTETDNGISLRFPRFKNWRFDKTEASNLGE